MHDATSLFDGEKRPDSAIVSRLDQPARPFKIDDAPLDEIFRRLFGDIGFSYCIDWNALAKANVPRATRMSLDLPSLPTRQLISSVISQIPGTPLPAWGMNNGVVFVSGSVTWETVFYDVHDIIVASLERRRSTRLHNDDAIYDDREAVIQELTQLISQSIVPELFEEDVGGQNGAIREIGDVLILRLSYENHKQVAALLAGLRRTLATSPSTQPIMLRQ